MYDASQINALRHAIDKAINAINLPIGYTCQWVVM